MERGMLNRIFTAQVGQLVERPAVGRASARSWFFVKASLGYGNVARVRGLIGRCLARRWSIPGPG